MAFEVFQRRLPKALATPTVTVMRPGYLRLNLAAREAIGCPERVELLMDRERMVIGIRPSDDEGSWRLQQSGQVTAKRFMDALGVDLRSVRFHAYMDSDMLCVDFNGEFVPVTSNRAHKFASR